MDLEAISVEVTEDWSILARAWNEGQEPEPNPMPWDCKYCGYSPVCPHRLEEKSRVRRTKKETAVQEAV